MCFGSSSVLTVRYLPTYLPLRNAYRWLGTTYASPSVQNVPVYQCLANRLCGEVYVCTYVRTPSPMKRKRMCPRSLYCRTPRNAFFFWVVSSCMVPTSTTAATTITAKVTTVLTSPRDRIVSWWRLSFGGPLPVSSCLVISVVSGTLLYCSCSRHGMT